MKKIISAILCITTILSLSVMAYGKNDLKWILEPTLVYEDVEYFEKNVYVYTENGKKGLVDNEGKVLINAAYNDFMRCTCGNVFVDGGKSSIISLNQGYTKNSSGRETKHPLCFGFYAQLNGSVKHVAVGDKTIARNLTAEDKPITFEQVSMATDNKDGGYKFSTLKRSGVYGYITSDNKKVFDGTLSNAMGFVDGIGAVKKGDKWAYITETGEYLTDFLYSDTKVANHLIDRDGVYLLREGLIPVCKEGLWGYIDKSGREVVPCMYEKTTPVFGGKAWVKYRGAWGVADFSTVPVIAESVTISGFLSTEGQYVGEKSRIGYSAEPPMAKVYWSSSNEDVVTVSEDGTATFNGVGDAAINACDVTGKVLAAYPVSVKEKPEKEGSPIMSTESKNLTAFVFTIIFGVLAVVCIVLIILMKVKKKKTVSSEVEKTVDTE